jgi:2-hydroxycyclohexanecarboxyl-CoA dehydrogenase
MTRTRRTAIAVPGALALVTGAGSGIGRATALELSRRGVRVLCADIDEAAAEKTVATCAELGAAGAAFAVDVADRGAMADLAERVHAEHGVLDVLVNNAGVGISGSFLDTRLDDWDWIVSINLMGVIHGCHAFGPAMVERGRGHVVNMSSGLAYIPHHAESAYVTTKAGVLAFSRALRADWHKHGVGVSAVCPGVINTPIVHTTRFRGEQADPAAVAGVQETFAQRGHPPELVARSVIGAVERNRAVVPVGREAVAGWYASRFLPTPVLDLMARASIDRDIRRHHPRPPSAPAPTPAGPTERT